MNPVVGVFQSHVDADRFVGSVQQLGVRSEKIRVFVPADYTRVASTVQTTDAEQPGVAAALGGIIGGATGVFAGLGILGTVLLPGIGTVTALGAAVALGAVGALGGATAGGALDGYLGDGLPADEVFVYEDALRQGKTVVFVTDDEHADAVRALLAKHGAESIDAAREQWWVGVRDAAEEEYRADGDEFSEEEAAYRRGCELAQHPALRGKTYEEASPYLAAHYPSALDHEAFRRGFQRGQSYRVELMERS